MKLEQSLHGGDIYTAADKLNIDPDQLLDFSANIMPFGLDQRIKNAVCRSIDSCQHYPDPNQNKLRQALARRHGLRPEQIVCGNGAADVLYRAVQAIKPQCAYLPVPSFLEYERALKQYDCEIQEYLLTVEANFKIDANFISWLETESAKNPNQQQKQVVILCQPNNPTGILIEPAILDNIVRLCLKKGLYLLLDECFLDFLHPVQENKHSLLHLLRQSEVLTDGKLLILRSMTKFYAMPGLRIGYLCTDQASARRIMNIGQPWAVGTLAEAAALAVLENESFDNSEDCTELGCRELSCTELACTELRDSGTVDDSEAVDRWLSSERPRLEQALLEHGFEVWHGAANFIFFRAVGCPQLGELMLKRKIMLRSCANYSGLSLEYYRIAVRTHEENSYFISQLSNILL